MNSFKKKLQVLAVAGAFGAAMLPGAAGAVETWQWNYGGATVFFGEGIPVAPAPFGGCPGAGAPGFPLSCAMNELKFTAESVIHWTSGTPFAPGSTFTDYVLLRIDQYTLGGVTANGASYGFDHQITAALRVNGTQTTTNTYTLNGTDFDMRLFYDAGVAGPSGAGAGYTFYNFMGTQAAVADGAHVESGFFVAGNGANTSAGLPDGSIDLIVGLVDVMAIISAGLAPFQVYTNNQFALRLGIADGNNKVCIDDSNPIIGAVCNSTETQILSFFGVAGVADADATHTRSDGSFQKIQAVPEPGSLALLGLGLAGLGFGASRRKKVAA